MRESLNETLTQTSLMQVNVCTLNILAGSKIYWLLFQAIENKVLGTLKCGIINLVNFVVN